MWKVATSKFINARCGGDPNEMLCARQWRTKQGWFYRHFPEHTFNAYVWQLQQGVYRVNRQAEFDFGPHIKCLRPQCVHMIVIRPDTAYCSNTCFELDKDRRHNAAVNKFLDYGIVEGV